jgi:hypothetical protein
MSRNFKNMMNIKNYQYHKIFQKKLIIHIELSHHKLRIDFNLCNTDILNISQSKNLKMMKFAINSKFSIMATSLDIINN